MSKRQPAPKKPLPPNPDWKHSPPRAGRFWVDPCDHSKGTFAGFEIDAMKWVEICGPEVEIGRIR